MVVSGYPAIPRILGRIATQNDIVSTTAETGMFNFNFPGGLMGTDKLIKITVLGDFLNNTGVADAGTFRVKVAGTNIYADTAVSVASNANRAPLFLQLFIGMADATNTMYMNGSLMLGTQGGATTGIGDSATDEILINAPICSTGTFTQDATASFTVSATWDFAAGSGSSSLSCRIHYAIAELL